MCRHTWQLLAAFISILHFCAGLTPTFHFSPGQVITISPDTLDNDTRVTIQCKAPPEIQNLTLLRIERMETGRANFTLLASAHSEHMQGQAVHINRCTTLDWKYGSVSGSLSNGSVSLTLQRAGCTDGGDYRCWGQGQKENGNESSFEEFYINATLSFCVIPGQLSLTSDRDVNQGLTEGSVVTLTCSGVIGTVDNETKVYLEWQYNQRPGDSFLYNVSDKGSEMIQPWTNMSVQSNCSNLRHGVWKLRQTLSVEDSGRLYMCRLKVGSEIRNVSLVLGTVSRRGKELSTTVKAVLAGSVLGVVMIVSLIVAAVLLRRHLSLQGRPGTPLLGQGQQSGLPPRQQLEDADTQPTDPSPYAVTTLPSLESAVKTVTSMNVDVTETSPSRNSCFMHVNVCYGDFAPTDKSPKVDTDPI